MKKKQMIVFTLIITILLTLLPIYVQAAQDNSSIKANVEKYASDGSLRVNLSNITLDSSHQYEFGISTNQATQPEDFYTINTYTNNTCSIELTVSTYNIKEVVGATDKIYLFIKDKSNSDEMVVDALPVDITLPLLEGLNIYFENDSQSYEDWDLHVDYLYGMTTGYYQLQKITDTNIINAYNQAMAEGKDISTIENLLTTTIPQSNWENLSNYSALGYGRKLSALKDVDDGLYYVWVQLTGKNKKTIYAYTLLEKGESVADKIAPTVKEISVQDPKSGSYKEGQKVEIRVRFSEDIVGETVPTLSIQFGTSPERKLTDGKIVNPEYTTYGYITYTYTIQKDDVGQLMATNLEGGSIKDTSGNVAILSCPAITGSTIIADQNATNNDDNNNDNNGGNNNQGENNNNNNNENNNQGNNNNNGNDPTTAPGTIPQTGETLTIIIATTILIIVGGLAVIKYRKYKDIK